MVHKRPGKAAPAVAAPVVAPAPEQDVTDYEEEERKPDLPLPGSSGRLLDVLIALAFFAVALFARLYKISDPAGIVFDEVHFNKYSTWYVSGHYFVDIHPPLAKLVFAGALKALGWVGAQEENVQWWTDKGFIGTKDWELIYDDEWGAPYVYLRMVAALAGSLLIPVVYLSTRALGAGRLPSAVAATLVLTETVSALQARLILCDAFLYLFHVASLGASFVSVAYPLSSARRWLWVGITGLMLGCAVSVKLTALGTLATVGIHQLIWVLTIADDGFFFSDRILMGVAQSLVMLGVGAVLFFGLWVLHIEILPYSGQGDGFSKPEFQALLKPKTFGPQAAEPPAPADPDACPNHRNTWSDCGWATMRPDECTAKGCCWDPTSTKAWCYHRGALSPPTMSTAAKIREVIRASIAINHGGAVMEHVFQSEWREWPLALGSTMPWGTTNAGAQLKSIANVGVQWPVAANVPASLLAVAVLALMWAARRTASLVSAATAAKRKAAASAAALSKRKQKALAAAASGHAAAPPDDAPAPDSTGGSSSSAAGGSEDEDKVAVDEALAVPSAPAWAYDGGAPRSTPLWLAWITLFCGYLLNLVPYELVERSKFIYHYNPALFVGVLLLAVSLDAVWAWAVPRGGVLGAPARPFIRRVFALALCLLALALAVAGYIYWGLPYVHGAKLVSTASFPWFEARWGALTQAEVLARQWHKKW